MRRIALVLILLAGPAWGKTLTRPFSSDIQTSWERPSLPAEPPTLWGHARH